MNTNTGTPRMRENRATDALRGTVSWSPIKSLWYLGHALIAIIGCITHFSLSGLLVFIGFTTITLCLGHSLGMHRRLIHNSYECPLWLEYIFVHFGVLVGMAGPIGMTHQHDLRDWAQRQPQCHSYLMHGESFCKDAWWQLNCDFRLKQPPQFCPEDRIKNDRVYCMMEDWWMLQQLPWALLLYSIGGTDWVVWGISVRIFVSITGHWLVGYFAHNKGQRDWHIADAAVQGHNIPIAAYLTMGESWHNNHHAFPNSANLGIFEHQADPGWWVLQLLQRFKLVWGIKTPVSLGDRKELVLLHGHRPKAAFC